jgi:type II secretory pathway pseudopilin PulG
VSAVAIVLIVLGAILVLLFVGGLIAARRRAGDRAEDLALSLARADQALEAARAADKGWERVMLEEAARKILADERPAWRYDRLDLVLVDDRPGVTEDTAHFLATAPDDEVRIVLTRVVGGAWIAKIVQ